VPVELAGVEVVEVVEEEEVGEVEEAEAAAAVVRGGDIRNVVRDGDDVCATWAWV